MGRDGNVDHGRDLWRELGFEGGQVGEFSGLEQGLQVFGQGGLAGMVGRQIEQSHHQAAGRLRVQGSIDGLPGLGIGTAREQGVPIDQVTQGLRLLLQRADDVAIIDQMSAVRAFCPDARQGDHRRWAEEAFQPVVEQVNLDLAADQPGWDGIEDAIDSDGAVAGDRRRQLGEIGGPARRQVSELLVLGSNEGSPTGVVPIADAPHEAPVLVDAGKVGAAALHQLLLDAAFDVPVGRLDTAILVGLARVVAGGGHAVVPAQLVIAPGEVGLGIAIEVLEGRGQRVGAVFRRCFAELPQRLLQSLGDRAETLAAKDHPRMLPAAVDQAKMVESVRERFAGDGHAEIVGDGEVGQTLSPRLVPLREIHLLVFAMPGPPCPNAPFQRPANSVRHGVGAILLLQRLEDGDRHHALVDAQQFLGPGPYRGQGIFPGPPSSRRLALRRRRRIVVDLPRRPFGKTSDRRRGGLRQVGSFCHVQSYLSVGDVKARHHAHVVLRKTDMADTTFGTDRQGRPPQKQGGSVAPPPARARLRSGLSPSLRLALAGGHTGNHSCR